MSKVVGAPTPIQLELAEEAVYRALADEGIRPKDDDAIAIDNLIKHVAHIYDGTLNPESFKVFLAKDQMAAYIWMLLTKKKKAAVS